jgi:hypothetical protein
MPWASHYFEAGANPGKYLSESGFRDFRALAPRWHATGGDIYGYSPGMEALGDVKQLQHEQLRKAQAIDYQTKPPLALPVSAKGHDVDIVPGGVSYFDSNTPHTGARTMFEARLEEKLLMLGPVLERLHNELLDPLIRLTFNDLLEAGAIPPPPPALNGQPIRVEFVSMLAQAQRAVGTASTDRFVSNLGVVAGFKPDVLDKFDADKWVDAYASWLAPPTKPLARRRRADPRTRSTT